MRLFWPSTVVIHCLALLKRDIIEVWWSGKEWSALIDSMLEEPGALKRCVADCFSLHIGVLFKISLRRRDYCSAI